MHGSGSVRLDRKSICYPGKITVLYLQKKCRQAEAGHAFPRRTNGASVGFHVVSTGYYSAVKKIIFFLALSFGFT
jgi:hypothetical protein